MMTSETFSGPSYEGSEIVWSHGDLIRRECRGIIFDSKTGDIIRRPFHKFFNAGEREETMLRRINLSQQHFILKKLDGSMIVPFRTSDNILRIGTKMGETEVAQQAAQFIFEREHYQNFIYHCLEQNLSPIFEWVSRKQRIVIDYPEDDLILLAVRHINTGEYLPYHWD